MAWRVVSVKGKIHVPAAIAPARAVMGQSRGLRIATNSAQVRRQWLTSVKNATIKDLTPRAPTSPIRRQWLTSVKNATMKDLTPRAPHEPLEPHKEDLREDKGGYFKIQGLRADPASGDGFFAAQITLGNNVPEVPLLFVPNINSHFVKAEICKGPD